MKTPKTLAALSAILARHIARFTSRERTPELDELLRAQDRAKKAEDKRERRRLRNLKNEKAQGR